MLRLEDIIAPAGGLLLVRENAIALGLVLVTENIVCRVIAVVRIAEKQVAAVGRIVAVGVRLCVPENRVAAHIHPLLRLRLLGLKY